MAFFPVFVQASHPLITDDAGTLGKGGMQIEATAETWYDKEIVDGATGKREGVEAALTATFGLGQDLDLVVVAPYQWLSVRENETLITREDGFGDMSLDLKWRFFERNGWAFALKPGITLPTGNDAKGLGGGRATYRITFITSKELDPWAFHLNLGYLRNENTTGDRTNLFHASVAVEREVFKNLKLVANICAETNPADGVNNHPASLLGGIIYALSDRVSVDAGVKFGLTESEMDVAYLLGVTFKF